MVIILLLLKSFGEVDKYMYNNVTESMQKVSPGTPQWRVENSIHILTIMDIYNLNWSILIILLTSLTKMRSMW